MILTIIAVGIFAILAVGCVLVIAGTFRKNKWGINTARITCPSCGAPISRVRAPKTIAQALWGGATCAKCGVEVDKWGRPAASTIPQR